MASDAEKDLAPFVGTKLATGRTRLAALFGRRTEWSALASTKKKHNMRRAIDRRFDGPKHLRARDYSDDEDGFGFW